MSLTKILLISGLVLGAMMVFCSFSSAADAMDKRRDEMLGKMLQSPYPPEGFWHYEDLAIAAYYLKKNARGDEAILQEADLFAKTKEKELSHFHWHAYILARIYFLFSSKSPHFPGRMSPEAEKALVDMLWQWASPSLSLEMTLPERDWWIWGSENHHIQAWSSAWGAAQVFAGRPEFKDKKYPDGTDMATMAKAFDAYFSRFALNRASRGIFVECNSGYNKYSIGPLSNIADFSQDPVVKRRMKMFLDVFWTDWAIEQIDAVRGGSRHRAYPGRESLEQGHMQGESWYLFGIGVPRSTHPSAMCVATSFYRPPALVTELVLKTPERGSYAYISRRPGRGEGLIGSAARSFVSNSGGEFNTKGLVYWLDPNCGDLVRYTWCTPDFIMGSSMMPALPLETWAGISNQNRWYGVIFGGHETARIFTQPLIPEKGSVYNDTWAVQNKGVMIAQRLKTAKAAKGQRVWFDGVLQRVEKDGWIFAQAPRAWAAVRVVRGATTWEKDDQEYHSTGSAVVGKGMWLACQDEFSPVIMEVARKSDYKNMEAFQKAILANVLTIEGAKLQYTSAGHKTALTLWSDYSQPPQVDGTPVNYAPAKAYDSPFLQGDFGSGVVTIIKGDQKLVLDFNKE